MIADLQKKLETLNIKTILWGDASPVPWDFQAPCYYRPTNTIHICTWSTPTVIAHEIGHAMSTSDEVTAWLVAIENFGDCEWFDIEYAVEQLEWYYLKMLGE